MVCAIVGEKVSKEEEGKRKKRERTWILRSVYAGDDAVRDVLVQRVCRFNSVTSFIKGKREREQKEEPTLRHLNTLQLLVPELRRDRPRRNEEDVNPQCLDFKTKRLCSGVKRGFAGGINACPGCRNIACEEKSEGERVRTRR
jgi:hypothetical protein